MALSFFRQLFGARRERAQVSPLYQALIAQARLPHWYAEGGVADTIDGRFDMVCAVLARAMIRLEALGAPARGPYLWLFETFVDDMEGQVRQIGIGDVVVGKHVGRMAGALEGRLGAYRAAVDRPSLEAALRRNLYRGGAPAAGALAHVADALDALSARLDAAPLEALLQGRF